MIQLSHEMRTRQQTTLTPRLQQSVKLLQMSTLEFSREVAQAIASNPFLDEHEESPDGDPAGNAAVEAAGVAKGDSVHTSSASDASATLDKPDAVHEGAPAEVATQYLAEDQTRSESSYSGDYPVARGAMQSDTDVGQWARSQPGLYDVLHENLCTYQLSERDRCLVELIIEALDDDGYLRLPFQELAPAEGLSPAATDTEWEVALHLVQQLAVPGLGARNLAECLNLQLNALPDRTSGQALALRVVDEGLDKLGKADYGGLARLLSVPEDAIREACVLIRTLDPRPASHYVSVDPSCYVVPDVIVRKVGKLWMAVANHESLPRARLHATYAHLFRESRYDDRSLMATALQEARWLIRSLEQRNTTIQRVAQAIVARQQTFFDYGEIALRPLMLSEIASELGMHESTVSRATSNKYLASPRGIYEFKKFFSRELATRSGGTCSAVAVRALIQEMIDEENPHDPFSDVTLSEKLAQEGIVVARRTVSKYRAQIKVPSAELRRAP